MPRFLSSFVFAEEAATAVEYAVMLALVLMTCIVAITSFGSASGGLWGGIQSDITTYTTPGGS